MAYARRRGAGVVEQSAVGFRKAQNVSKLRRTHRDAVKASNAMRDNCA
jgi:hypothetical protein